ncbi:MAG: alpha/beta hydrolase [Methanoregula sp.]|jgi:pimeloyl-ACP methyl ester carboxylesterase|nr:alpha/beta hydrolase [Methanoregula sp.]
MNNYRTWGRAPFATAVIHGGPGAAGEMAAVAHELSRSRGVIEPFQTEMTVSGQVTELKKVLNDQGDLPVTLLGHSWGAILSFIVTAKNPAMVKKLILVSSGVFDNAYAAGITRARLHRLSQKDREVLETLATKLNGPKNRDKNRIFAEFGKVIETADTWDPLLHTIEGVDYRYDIYENVWKQAQEMRTGGDLVALGRYIHCPVVAIHGDYDPHPADGIQIPLSRVIKNFRFILLENCGHRPWLERSAKTRFYEILNKELD